MASSALPVSTDSAACGLSTDFMALIGIHRLTQLLVIDGMGAPGTTQGKAGYDDEVAHEQTPLLLVDDETDTTRSFSIAENTPVRAASTAIIRGKTPLLH